MWKLMSGPVVTAGAVLVLVVGSAATARAEGKIDPKADQYLKQCCSYLGGLKDFTFRVDDSSDDVDDNGQKLQFSNHRHVIVSRPNKVAVEASGDTANRKFYYNGKKITLFDTQHNTYGTERTAGTLDAMLDQMHEQFGYTPPLADLFFSDPYKVLTEHVDSGAYIGLSHVGDIKCHHLAFRQKGIDWQIWIAEGDQPLPRKLVMTYKREAGEPQYSARFTHWDVNPKLTDADFEFKPPEDARKISFVKVHEETHQEKEPPKK